MWLTPFHSLANDKILDSSKLKAFANDKINVTEKLNFVFARIQNIVGKQENAGYQHFLLFSQVLFPKVVTSLDCAVKKLQTTKLWTCPN